MHASVLQPGGFQAQRCSASASHIQDLILPPVFPFQGQHHSLLTGHPDRFRNHFKNITRNSNRFEKVNPEFCVIFFSINGFKHMFLDLTFARLVYGAAVDS